MGELDDKQTYFTVVMPSYNHHSFIDNAILSVVNQSCADWELVVIDDCSTDSSQNIIESWVHKDSRIRAIYHSSNMGIANTCNDGIRIAKGLYILMMASDDMLGEDCLNTIRNYIIRCPLADVFIIDGEIISDNNRKTGELFSGKDRKPTVNYGNFFNELITGNFILTGAVNTNVLRQHGITYDTSIPLHNDWLFWLTLSSKSEFCYINESLYYYRIHGNNTMLRDNDMAKDRMGLVLDILENKYDFCKRVNMSTRLLLADIFTAESLKYNDYESYRKFNYHARMNIKSNKAFIDSIIKHTISYSPPLLRYYLKFKHWYKTYF